MGKSLGNAIYLSDDEETVVNKVKSAVTDTNRIAVSDLGNPDVCMVSLYQKSFNTEEYDNICEMCRNAKIGCVACKKILYTKLNATLAPIRERRSYYENHKTVVREMIFSGTGKANKLGAETIESVKSAMKILI
jgi:tryptophanyl-tRNA synthetase